MATAELAQQKWGIYQIDEAIRDIIENDIDPESGEISYEVSEKLDALQMAKEELVKNVILFYKEASMFQEGLKAEKKRLAELDSSLTKKLDKLFSYIKANVPEGEKVKTPQYEIGWRKSSTVEVDPLADLAGLHKKYPELVKETITYAPDKLKIKADYKEIGILPEGFSIQDHLNMSIK